MSIKLADTLQPMADFPSAYAKDIAFDDGDTLQEKLDTGSLGGDGANYKQLSQAEYDALTEDEKLDGREYRTYDTGHIYKLGVEYGKDGVQISDNETVEDKTWSSKKTSDEIAKVDTELKGSIEEINDSLVYLDEKKADADKVVNFEYIRDTSSEDAKELIQKHWSEHENFKFYNLHLDTSKWAWSAEIYFHTSEYGTVLLRSYGSDALNIWYGKVYEGVWTWKELATMDEVESKYIEANIIEPTDWDTLNTKARYYFSGGTSMTNSPEAVPFGLLEVIDVSIYCIVQRYFDFNNGKLYMRRWSGNSWNEWYKFDSTAI